MNRKEVNEIRRRLRLERNNISHIYGCYVNAAGEIVSHMDEPVSMLTQEETEKYFSLLKKTLSGNLGRNLMDLSFATKQVMDSDEVRLLTALRKSELKDEVLREELYKCIIRSVSMEDCGYLILLACDIYDVPHFGKDGQLEEDSGEVFKYMLCCICPVKSGKAQFGYSSEEKRFLNIPGGQLVSSPELGFMYPCFDDRSANIYNALLYSRSVSDDHQAFIDAVFRTNVPMPAESQREAFNSVLTEALEKDCSFTLMHAVHDELSERISVHKESRDPEPLTITTEDMGSILEDCGASSEQVKVFEEKCREQFGDNALLSPANIIDSKKFKLTTPEVKITVDPQFTNLIETRIIDGKKYILIHADSGVEVNGVAVSIE